jgi:hypothetical protein
LVKVTGSGKTIETNGYGDAIKSAFGDLRAQVETAYGSPSHALDEAFATTIWNESRDWMMALKNEERFLDAIWSTTRDFDGKGHPVPLPNHLKTIQIEAKALSTSKGYIRLTYEFEGFEQYIDQHKAAQGAALR